MNEEKMGLEKAPSEKELLLKELYNTIIMEGDYDDENPMPTFDEFLSRNQKYKDLTVEEIQKEIDEFEGRGE